VVPAEGATESKAINTYLLPLSPKVTLNPKAYFRDCPSDFDDPREFRHCRRQKLEDISHAHR
jgi:hypothetical protein